MRARLFPGVLLALAASAAGCAYTQLTGTPNWQPDPQHAAVLQDEENNGNGIEVGAPKIYDDASLRMMLNATRAKLAGMSGLNQDTLISRLGSVSGATIDQTQFGFQVTGPAAPSTATTNTGATNSATTNGNLPQGNTSLPGTVTVATDPTQSTVTTSTPQAPAAAPTVAPGLAFAPPTSVAPSSLDVLNEQMQLSYELANLELLLEGSLSDRFIINQRIVKPRVTLGFPISLRAPTQFKDAVAVVEVTVKTATPNLSNPSTPDRPAILALLPRDKTYNVAAMTDSMTSIGAGAVIGTVGVAASYLKGHKTLYLVQDQDTVALQRPPPGDVDTTSFVWEFHPVLGQRYVRSGMKQTFVQLAFPVLNDTDCFGRLEIRTYWRRFDQKSGVAGEVIAESALVARQSFPIAHFDLTPAVEAITYQDLGDGTVQVAVRGSYLEGTYIQLGPTRYEAGKSLLFEDAGVKFVAPAAALAQWTAYIVARSGAATALLQPLAQQPLPTAHPSTCVSNPPTLPDVPGPAPTQLSIGNVAIQPLNETTSQVRIALAISNNVPNDTNKDDLLVVIGGKVFGLRDNPVRRDNTAASPLITATVPTALLIANPQVRVFLPFWSDPRAAGPHWYDASKSLADQFGPAAASERLVLVSTDPAGGAVYLLYGNNLARARLLVPEHDATLETLDNIDPDRLRLLRVKKAALQTTRKIVLQKSGAQNPLLLELPDPKPQPPKVSADSPVIQGTQELDVTTEQAPDVTAVKLKDRALHWTPIDKSTLRLLTLKTDAVTREQGTREITIEYKSGAKATLTLEVVAARIGVK